MKFGLPLSVLIHGLAIWGGLGLYSGGVVHEEVPVIPLQIVSVSDFTNIAATRRERPKPEPKLEKKTETETTPLPAPEIEKPKPETPEKQIEDSPEPEKQAAIVEPAPEEDEIKPKETKPKKTAPKPFSLDDFSKMIEDVRKEDPKTSKQIVLKGETGRGKVRIDEADQNGVGERSEMQVSTQDYIRTKMRPCWKVDRGAKDYLKLRVVVVLELDPRGEILDLKISNSATIIASGETAWRVARENVVAALHECAPYHGLKAQNHSEWKTLKLNFQPAGEE